MKINSDNFWRIYICWIYKMMIFFALWAFSSILYNALGVWGVLIVGSFFGIPALMALKGSIHK